MADRAYYSLIQYCPDRGRAEVANVGVVMFRECPLTIAVKVTPDLSHTRRTFYWMDVDTDLGWLRIALAALSALLCSSPIATLHQLRVFISRQSGDLLITDPRSMRSDDAAGDVERLFKDLVEVAAEK